MKRTRSDKEFDVVIYHGPCNDGFGGAFCAWLNNKNSDFIDLEPRNEFPTQLLTTLLGKSVIMIDIAFSREIMVKLYRICRKFVVLDHHKTSRDNLKGLDFAIFDMNKSGCMLAWEYFFPNKTIPRFLEYIGLRDIWKHKNNLEALYFTTEFPGTQTFEAYNAYYISDDLINQTIKKGQFQHEYMMNIVEKISETAIDCIWEGYPTKVVSQGWFMRSEVGDFLAKKFSECVVLFFNRELGQQYNYSLRSYNPGEHDSIPEGPIVSEIAKKYGGGGHPHACGFKSQKSPEDILGI